MTSWSEHAASRNRFAGEAPTPANDFPTLEAAIGRSRKGQFVYHEGGKYHLANPGEEPKHAIPVEQVPRESTVSYEASERAPVIYDEEDEARFADVKTMLLEGLRARGWTVASGLKVPHATSPDGKTRLWFRSQAIYMNDPGTDPRRFESTHSLSSDMREYSSVDDLLADVDRRLQYRGVAEAPAEAADAGCLPWVRVARDPERYEGCLARARRIGPIKDARKVYDLLGDALAKEDQEVFVVVLCDVRGQLRGVSEVHRGGRSRVGVSPPDVFRVVIATGSEAFVVVHCHPSGKADPSEADKHLTKSIEDGAKVVGDLVFLDHVIIASKEYYSFRDKKLTKVR